MLVGKRGAPRKAITKKAVTVLLSPDTLAWLDEQPEARGVIIDFLVAGHRGGKCRN